MEDIIKKDNYNAKREAIKTNNINLKCVNIISVMENIIRKEPIPINNYNNILVYKKMDVNCIKCANTAEYYLCDDRFFCWTHSQHIK